MSLKDQIIAVILRDRTRFLTICVAVTLATAGGIATKLLGFNLTAEHNAFITLIATAVFGWVIEAYASDQNAKGVVAAKTVMRSVDSRVEVDGHAGEEFVGAVADLARTADPGDPYPKSGQKPINNP